MIYPYRGQLLASKIPVILLKVILDYVCVNPCWSF
jgi:hypothetical protein